MDWSQWKTILWLRWRLTCNQWARQTSFGEIVSVLLGVLLTGGAILSAGAGLLAGRWLADSSKHTLLLTWDIAIGAFLFWWLIGLLADLQRRESLDLARLMHLPVALRQVFFFNYLVSWATPSIILILPGFLSLALSLAIFRSPWFLLLIPMILGIFLLATSWTYLLRGWLASLMANERRRRSIVVAVSVVLIGVAQLPNLFIQMNQPRYGPSASTRHSALPAWLGPAHYVLPPLWVGKSAETLAGGNPAFAVAATGGTLLLGGLALWLGYVATIRAYLGSPKLSLRVASASPAASPPARSRSRLLEKTVPFVPDEVGVVALATLQSHLRAPEVKMVLFSQVLMNVVFGFLLLRPRGLAASFSSGDLLIGSMIAMFSMMGASQLFFNQFGFDRDGFRAYVLSPISRSALLFGKALGTFPFVAAIGFLLLLAALLFRLLPPVPFVASLISMVAAYLLFASVGNWLSIMSPYRMAQGSLKPTKSPSQVTFIVLAGMLLSPLAAAVIFLPAILGIIARMTHLANGELVYGGASVLLLGLGAALFFSTLGPLGRLLARREKNVLLAVTQELE